jgi:hypothetical protein
MVHAQVATGLTVLEPIMDRVVLRKTPVDGTVPTVSCLMGALGDVTILFGLYVDPCSVPASQG